MTMPAPPPGAREPMCNSARHPDCRMPVTTGRWEAGVWHWDHMCAGHEWELACEFDEMG